MQNMEGLKNVHIEENNKDNSEVLADIKNVLSLKSFIESKLGNNNTVYCINEMSKEVNLEYIAGICTGYRKVWDGGYYRSTNEQVSSPLMFMKLVMEYEKYITLCDEKPTLSKLLYKTLHSFKLEEDRSSILDKPHTYAHHDLLILDILLAFKDYKNISEENKEYLEETEEFKIYELKSLIAKFLDLHYKLEKYLILTNTESLNFNVNTCTITTHRNSPPTNFALESSYVPNNSAQIAETLIYNNRNFYITDIINNEGTIEYKTSKSETMSYKEYKDMVLEELKAYNIIMRKHYDINLENFSWLNNIEITSVNNVIDVIRNHIVK